MVISRCLIAVWLSVGYPGYSYFPNPPAASSSQPATAERSNYEYATLPQQNGPPPSRQDMQDQSPVHRDQTYQQRPLPPQVITQRKALPQQQRTAPQMLLQSDLYNMDDSVKTYVAGTVPPCSSVWDILHSVSWSVAKMAEIARLSILRLSLPSDHHLTVSHQLPRVEDELPTASGHSPNSSPGGEEEVENGSKTQGINHFDFPLQNFFFSTSPSLLSFLFLILDSISSDAISKSRRENHLLSKSFPSSPRLSFPPRPVAANVKS